MSAKIAPRSLLRASSRLSAISRVPAVAPRWSRSMASSPDKSRTAIVTGSSRGMLGRAIALRLAQDGYDVCVNDIPNNKAGAADVVSEIESMGRKAIVALGDVSKRSDVKKVIDETVSKLGPLDTMVANAGIAQVKPLLNITDEDFRRMFEVNVTGVFNSYVEAAKQMIEQGNGGKLIGAASIVAYRPFAMISPYSASKWAVRGLTQAFAMEMARYKITVNAYAPGVVGTAMWDLIDEELGKIDGRKKGETFKKFTEELTLLGRPSVPEDVSKTVSFLAGPDSEFVTGQTVIVDGGIQFS